jgi:hypothetical protein
MGIKIQTKNLKNEKPKHIAFLIMSYIVNTQVDKQARSRHIQTRKIMCISTPNPKLCLMKSIMKRIGFGFQTWKFQVRPKSFIYFRVTN